jgi:hypothetical protein
MELTGSQAQVHEISYQTEKKTITILYFFQLREGMLSGTLAGHKVNYLDSGYSEEDADQQITSCLMKTSSGSIYIPPSEFNLTMKFRSLIQRIGFRFKHRL